MNRRQALIVVGTLVAGLKGRWPSRTQAATPPPRPEFVPGPGGELHLNFGEGQNGIDKVVLTRGRRSVTVTPTQIMDALEGKE